MKKYMLFLLIGVILIGMTACNRGRSAGGSTMKEEAQPVMLEQLEPGDLNEYITISGKLEGITQVTMTAEASGRVLELYKRLGDRVSKGQRIGRLDNEVSQLRLQQAEAAVASAESSFDNAQRNFTAVEQLKARGLASDAEFDSANSALRGAKAGLDGARAALQQARSGLEASYLSAAESGVISALNVSVGQFVAAGQPVAVITDASTLILKSGVGESQISKLRVGQSAIITHPEISGSIQGRVRGFGISPAMGSATYPVEIALSGTSGLMPGMVATARILSNQYKNVFYTSITNVVNEFDRNYIFIVGDDQKAQKREVSLGRTVGENVEILSGAEPGEKIVTSGSENLEDGSLVDVRN